MATIQDQIAQARAAGYDDATIAEHLRGTSDLGPKVKTALGAGYNPAEILSHLTDGRVSVATPVVQAPVKPDEGQPISFGSPMGDIVGEAFPNTILDREPAIAPPVSPTTSFAPVVPEMRKAAQAAWNAATPERRTAMQAQPGWRGQLAREQAGLVEGISPETSGVMAEFDPRVEARTRQLLLRGEQPEFAAGTAQKAARAGVTPGKEVEFVRTTEGLADEGRDFRPGESLSSMVEAAEAAPAGAKPVGMGEITSNALVRGALQTQGMGSALLAAGAKSVGADDLALSLLKNYFVNTAEAKKYPADIENFTKIDSWSDVPTYAIEAVLENLPQLVGTVGLGTIGGIVAKRFGARAVADMVAEQAAKALFKRQALGVAVGAGTSAIGMEVGSIYGDIARETKQERPGVALAFGTVAGALDAIPAMRAARTILGPSATSWAVKEIVKRYGAEAGKQLLAEGGTEFLQTWVEKAATSYVDGRSLLTKENLVQAVDAFLKGGISGTATGVATKGISEVANRQANRELAETEKATKGAEAAKQAALAKWSTFSEGRTPAAPATPPTAAAQPAPSVPPQPTPSALGAITPEQTARISALAQQYVAAGIDENIAGLMAIATVKKEAEVEQAAQVAAAPPVAPPVAPPPEVPPELATRVADIEDELINAGVPPDRARADALTKAQEEAADDAAAAAEEPAPVSTPPTVEEPPNAGQPIDTAGGAGPSVAGVTDQGISAPGVESVEPVGVVPTGEDVGKPAVGEGQQPLAVAKTVKLFRGVQSGQEGQETVGGALFMSPDRKVAETYAGENGSVSEVSHTFNNLLEAPTWLAAKEQVGLDRSSTMAELVDKARAAGYDGVSFNTTNGPEYIVIPPAVTEEAGKPAVGEGQQPPAVTEEPTTLTTKEAPSGPETVETEQAEPEPSEAATPEFFDRLGVPPTAAIRKAHAGAELNSPDLRAALVRLTQNKLIQQNPKTLDSITGFLRDSRNIIARPLENIAFPGRATPALAPPVLRVNAKQKLTNLNERLRSGEITLEQHANEVEDIVYRMQEAARVKKGARKITRERGADIVREKLLAASRRGEIGSDGVELAMWVIGKNPQLAEKAAISIKKAPEDAGLAVGMYVPAGRLVVLFKNTDSYLTATHEILHHTERMMPKDVQDGIRKEWAKQYANAVKNATDPKQREALETIIPAMYGSLESRNKLDAAFDDGTLSVDTHYQLVNPSEFWAVNAATILSKRYGATSWVAQAKQWLAEFLQKAKGLLGLPSDSAVLKALKTIVDGDGKFLSAQMLSEGVAATFPAIAPPPTPPTPAGVPTVTPAVVRTQKQIDKDVAIATDKFVKSQTATEAAEATHTLLKLRDGGQFVKLAASNTDAMTNKVLSATLFVLPTDVVAKWGSSVLGSENLNNTNDLIGNMRGMQHQLLKAAGLVSENMMRAIKADPSLRTKLEEVVYTATIARVDPSLDPTLGTGKDERSPPLFAKYKNLGPEGQRIYNELKTYYESMVDYYGFLLDEQVKASNLPTGAQAVIMAEIKKLYEVDKRIVPYFPLVRNRGDYWLRVGEGKLKEFYTFGTIAERDAVMDQVAKRKNTTVEAMLLDKKQMETGDDLTSFRIAGSEASEMLKSTFAKIDAVKNTGGQSPAVFAQSMSDLKDSIYDLFLTTLPDQSFRKSFIARKDIIGFNVDIVRNFSTSAMHMGGQLARIAYSAPIRNSLAAAQKSLEGNPKKSKYERFVQEMQRRAALELHPFADPAAGISKAAQQLGGAVADVSTRLSFIHYLSSASSALIQLSTIPYGAANLGARHGYAKALAELSKLTPMWNTFGVRKQNPDGSVSWFMPTMAESTNVGLNADEQRAMKAMGTRGVDITLTNELLGRGRVSSASYEGAMQKVGRVGMTIVGGLFHNMERISREVIFMTSYRLSRKAGKTHDQAVDQAVADTYDSAGNMAEWNRAPAFRGAPGRLAMQFLSYPMFQTVRIGKTFANMLPFLNQDGKTQALKEFAGIMGVTWMLAGTVGLPLFSVLIGAVGFILDKMKDEDKPEDLKSLNFEEYFKQVWVPEKLGDTKLFGKPVSDLVLQGPTNFFTGLDISARTSLNDLWFKDRITSKNPREEAISFAVAHAGPSVNLALSYLDGYKAYKDGDMQKFGEKVLPAVGRGPMAAWKYFHEGAKDVHGSELMSRDSFTTGALLAQAIGFRNTELSNLQAVNFKMYSLGQKIGIERTNILRNLGDAYIKDQPARMAKWEEEVGVFNKKFPIKGLQITAENLIASRKRVEGLRAKSWKGMALTPANIALFVDAAAPTRDAAEWLETQAKPKAP